MKCASLFSGCGGLDLGLEAAGIEVVGAMDFDDDCCQTLKLNGRDKVFCSGINDEAIRSSFPEPVDLVVGGPPCQPFSKSAQWTNHGTLGLQDKRAKSIDAFASAIALLSPQAFILENVEGFERQGGLDHFLSVLDEKGCSSNYDISTAIINAADHGIPQKRRRFFAIGMAGRTFSFPKPTHGPDLQPYVTAWDAISEFAQCELENNLAIKGRWADLVQTIPPGKNYLHHTPRGEGHPIFGWRTRYWSFLYKLSPDHPSPTIVASPSQNTGPFHWQNRLLSIRELAALQGFPSHYAFAGNRASMQRQIGNAVPPALGEVLGRELLTQMGTPPVGECRLALSKAELAAPSPICAELPPQFRKMVGNPTAHPGTGKGPRPRTELSR